MHDYTRLARPGQWIKNGFVLVGVLFGHAWADVAAVQGALTLFAAFCLVSSAVYAFNDVMDRHADRVHPHKHRRPVASGRISAARALVFAVLLLRTHLDLRGDDVRDGDAVQRTAVRLFLVTLFLVRERFTPPDAAKA